MSHTVHTEKRITSIINRPDQAPGERARRAFQHFVHSQVTGSIVLLVCTVIALVWANSAWGHVYFELLHTELGLNWGESHFSLSLHGWINDGLMAIFFFVVGLEIKREISVGQLSSMKQAILPVTAALGGMIVPAAIYLVFNAGGAGARGWGVPMSTDIAFALGILALLGKRVPLSLKVFLTALAIADDMGAVLVIALFYTEQIWWGALGVSGLFLLLMLAARRSNVRRPLIYILLAIGVWAAVFVSGIHATVAGILLALIVPVKATIDPHDFFATAFRKLRELNKSELTTESMIEDRAQLNTIMELQQAAWDMRSPGLVLEERLHAIVVYFVLPLFALTNAGVVLDGRIFRTLANPISIGIILGLVLGKQIGITLFSWLAIKSGYADLPEGVTWLQIYGASWLAGVGFTMSLFVSELAFTDETLISEAKVGILAASILAGLAGYFILQRVLPQSQPTSSPELQPVG